MAKAKPSPNPSDASAASTIRRAFEHPTDALVAYTDYVQVVGTGEEVYIQFYESIPGPRTSKRLRQ